MINSIVAMFTTTVALIVVCILGVAGSVDSMTPYRDAFVIRTEVSQGGAAFGGFIFTSATNTDAALMDHEYGHLLQNRAMGAAGLPLLTIGSVTAALLYSTGILTPAQYDNAWPEAWATELGDGIR